MKENKKELPTDRREYYKQYYKELKKNPKKLEIRRERARLYARGRRDGTIRKKRKRPKKIVEYKVVKPKKEFIPKPYDGPDREFLNKLWNKYRNYRGMAKELGVTAKKIEKWLGLEILMSQPWRVYKDVNDGISNRIKSKEHNIGWGSKYKNRRGRPKLINSY